MMLIMVLSSAIVMILTEVSIEVQLFVYKEKSCGESSQPCRAPVLVVWISEVSFPNLTCFSLPVRKFVIHWEVGTGLYARRRLYSLYVQQSL